MNPFDSTKFKVYVGGKYLDQTKLGDHYIVITPSENTWDDFRIQTFVSIKVTSLKKFSMFEGIFGFIDQDFDTLREGQNFLSPNGLLQLERNKIDFFLVLSKLGHYREFVRVFGSEEASEALCAIHDIAAFKEFGGGRADTWFNKVKKTKVFTYSVRRHPEAYFAIFNAGGILRGREANTIGARNVQLAVKYKLVSFTNKHEMLLEFNADKQFKNRVSVLIGENGTGKSQALNRIAKSAINLSENLQDAEGEIALVSRVLALAPTTESGRVFPYNNAKNQSTWYRRFILNKHRSGKGNMTLSEAIIQLVLTDQKIGDLSRWDIFLSSIDAIDNVDQIAFRKHDEVHEGLYQTSKERFIFLSTLDRGKEQLKLEKVAEINENIDLFRVVEGREYPLSSGEASFLRFAGYVCNYIENGSLLLIDEPETHLHPQFISRFMKLLDTLLTLTGSVSVIATHSVYFAREVAEKQVKILKKVQDNRIEVISPRIKTFGADVGRISRYVFGEDKPSINSSELLNEFLKQNLTWEELEERYGNQLSDEFLMHYRIALREVKNEET